MTDHPENTPINRFFTFWWALGVVFVFGLLAFLVAGVASSRPGGDEAYDAARAAERSAKLRDVRAAQAKLLAGGGEAVEGGAGQIRVPLEVAAELIVKEAGKKVPRVTTVPVPGTPAALELMKKQAAEAEAAKKEEESKEGAEAKEAPAPAAAPAAKPADKPADKPAAKAAAKKPGAKKGGAKKGGAKKGGAKKGNPKEVKPADQ